MNYLEQWSDRIVYKTLIGSRAYGLHSETSDYDWRGLYVAPFDYYMGLKVPPEQLESKEPDICYWEVGKFARLALNNNPAVLEITQARGESDNALIRDFLDPKHYLSKKCFQTYGGYARAQLQRFTSDGNFKNAMHMLRLYLAGIHALKYGEILLDVSHFRDKLLSVRQGKLSDTDILLWAAELEGELREAYVRSYLPEEGAFETVHQLVIQLRYNA